MSLTVRSNFMSAGMRGSKGLRETNKKYVVIHETGNNAPADNEIRHMINNVNGGTSFHVAIDEKEAVEGLQFKYNAYHVGDGEYGDGNSHGIGIEICYQTGSDALYKKSVDNAVIYVADVLKQYGWGVDRLRRHRDFNGKDCPNGINHSRYLNWEQFKARVQSRLNELNGKAPAPTPQPSKPSNNPGYGVMIEVPVTEKEIVCNEKEGLTAWNSPQDFSNGTGRAKDGDVKTIGHYDTINREAFVRRKDDNYILGKSVITGKWIVLGTWYYAGAIGDINTRKVDELYIK